MSWDENNNSENTEDEILPVLDGEQDNYDGREIPEENSDDPDEYVSNPLSLNVDDDDSHEGYDFDISSPFSRRDILKGGKYGLLAAIVGGSAGGGWYAFQELDSGSGEDASGTPGPDNQTDAINESDDTDSTETEDEVLYELNPTDPQSYNEIRENSCLEEEYLELVDNTLTEMYDESVSTVLEEYEILLEFNNYENGVADMTAYEDEIDPENILGRESDVEFNLENCEVD